eukprot:7024630-Alexandrium_andersonii.AAC.2
MFESFGSEQHAARRAREGQSLCESLSNPQGHRCLQNWTHARAAEVSADRAMSATLSDPSTANPTRSSKASPKLPESVGDCRC